MMKQSRPSSSVPASRRTLDSAFDVLAGGRSVPAMIELVFGLFLISGMGFLYLRRRVAGWGVLLLRLAVLIVLASLTAEVHPSIGPVGLLIGWALPPVVLAHIVSRSKVAPPALVAQAEPRADLESLGWFGLAGLGWTASRRPSMGVTMLLLRLVMLGAGVIAQLLLWLTAADACVYEDNACAGLQLSALLTSLFWLALWLAFPVCSGALLRAASGLEIKVGVPRALAWIALGLLALFVVPTLLQLLLVR